MKYVFILLIFTLLAGCNSHQQKLFKELKPEETGVNFVNQLRYTDSLTVLEFEYMFNGAGVALADFNNDNRLDIFFTGNMVSSRLYLNKSKEKNGSLHFDDITQQAGVQTDGWAYGAAVVDINQDGWQDVYVCKAGSRKSKPESMKNLFFINNGPNKEGIPTFTERATEMNLADDGYDIHAAFFDYDKDGDMDMYLVRNAFVNYNRNNSRPKQTDGQSPTTGKLFRNESKGRDLIPNNNVPASLRFTDVSYQAGIRIEGFGLGINISDLNNDDWPDVYVSNDFLTNDLVYINNHDGTFSNQAGKMLRHQTYNGMGNDVADFNNDGLPDITVVDMLPPDNKRWKLTMMGNIYDEFQHNIGFGYEPQYVRNTLQLNNGDGSFSEIGQLSGIHATEWSWSPLFADYDNDGWKDLFISNGYRQDVTNLDFIMYGKKTLFMGTPEANRKDRLDELQKFKGIQVHNYVFQNNRDLTFSDVSEKWGLEIPTYSNGSAYGDLDNDGDLDLVINNLDQPASIFENQLERLYPKKQWLRLSLEGAAGNRDGLGAKVWLWQKEQMQFAEFSPYRGYLSTVEPFLHFGLQEKKVDSLKVRWPDGKEQLLKNISAKQLLKLSHKNAKNKSNAPIPNQQILLFEECSKACEVEFEHHEDNYVDFKQQALLPHLHSLNGPGLAVGDVNNDGLDDFFVGAPVGQQGVIFLQQKTGKFLKKTLPETNSADDMGALFFDADADDDIDLYVASGGVVEDKQGAEVYQHRLYLNDGKGNMIKVQNALPQIRCSGSSVVAADYDHDGDLDVFVGGRVSPNEYPLAPRSYLLRNDSSGPHTKFTDITPKELTTIGMVTSALWTDFDNDNWVDLMIVGEFMPITFFKNRKGKLVINDGTLWTKRGWWNSLASGDFDKDGDIDYIVGNLGLNTQLKASTTEPVCIYAKDYDKNGRLDPIMCHFMDGKEYMIHARDDMSKQITAMRGRFRTYEEYADVTFDKAFRKDELEEAYVVKSEWFENTYLENLGKGQFKLHTLPLEAQFSPIFGMNCGDFNNDGNLDVLSVGNSFTTEVNYGRYDAQGSLILWGNGKGQFRTDRKTLNMSGDNKSIARLQSVSGASLFLVGVNSDRLKVLKNSQKSAKTIPLRSSDSYAIIVENSGRQHRQEFYFGNSYLSQSSRNFAVPAHTKTIYIHSIGGGRREVKL